MLWLWGTAAALPLRHFSCLAVRGSGAAQEAKDCPRQPQAAQRHVGSSHCTAAIEQGVPTAVHADIRHIRTTGQGQLGLIWAQLYQVLVHAGEQTPSCLTPHMVCSTSPKQRGSTTDSIPSAVRICCPCPPQHFHFRFANSSGAGAPPLEPMRTIETVPLVSATDQLLLSNQQHTKDMVKLTQRLYPSSPLQLQKSFHKN